MSVNVSHSLKEIRISINFLVEEECIVNVRVEARRKTPTGRPLTSQIYFKIPTEEKNKFGKLSISLEIKNDD